jgi:hypothetical protein
MQEEKLVKKQKVGRKNHYWVYYPMLLSYPLEGPYQTVVELARALTDLARQLRDGEIPMDFPDNDDPNAPALVPR